MSQDFPIKPNSFSVPLIGCPLSLTLCSGWSWRTLRPHPHRGARAGSSWWLCGRGWGPATDWALIGGFVSYSMDIMDVSLIPDGALRNGEWRKQSVGQSNIYMLINTITNYARVCVHFLGLLIKPTTTNKTHTHTLACEIYNTWLGIVYFYLFVTLSPLFRTFRYSQDTADD